MQNSLQEKQQSSETKSDQNTNNNEIEKGIDDQNNDIEQKMDLVANYLFEMRRKVLTMEISVVKAFIKNKLIENDNDTLQTVENDIEFYSSKLCAPLDDEKLEILHTTENLSTELMKKIKEVIRKKAARTKEAEKSVDDIEIFDYRSIVTVRGTKEDVINCILKAKTAMETYKYDRAESLLLKAERIFSTKNARDLLKQVRAVKESKQNPQPIEQTTKAEEHVNTVTEEKLLSEDDSINAGKCLTAFKEAFIYGNLEKAERLLHKAKRLDPSLDVDEQLSLVKAVITSNNIAEIKKTKKECHTAGECLYKSMKAYDAGDFLNAEEFLLFAKNFDRKLNLEPELSNIRTKMASKNTNEIKAILKTVHKHTVTESDIKFAAAYLYKAKKAYDAGNFREVQRNLNGAKTFDHFLGLEPYLSKCRTHIASKRSETKSSHEITTSESQLSYLNGEQYRSSKHLKHTQCVTASQSLRELATTSKTSKRHEVLKQERADLCIGWAISAMGDRKFHVALRYMEQAFKIRPNEITKGYLVDIRRKIQKNNEQTSDAKNDFVFEAETLLDKTQDCLFIDDFERAELLLDLSWGMYKSQRTISIYQKFIQARIDHFSREDENILNERNVNKSYWLVESALDKYKNKQYIEAKKLLNDAHTFYPNALIDKFLFEVCGAENAEKSRNNRGFLFWL